MTYNDVVECWQSPALKLRVTAGAATQEHITNPETFVMNYWWKIVASPGWDEAWAYKQSTDPNFEGDIGALEDVINDAMILSAIQTLVPPTEG